MNEKEKSLEEKISILIQEQAECKNLIQKLIAQPASPTLGDWTPEAQAMKLLLLGKTSLWKLREAGEIVATGTRPIFYSLKSIINYLEKKSKK